MKHIAIVALSCVLAVGTSAQQQPVERPVELASAFAALEQEHDLDKAAKLFAAVADDDKVATGVREAAATNLMSVLMRLGRREEANAAFFKALANGLQVQGPQPVADGQDPEREQELRVRARELLSQTGPVLGMQGPPGTGVVGLPVSMGEQLLWIGRAAVPEVIASVQAWHDWREAGYHDAAYEISRGVGLFRFLWMVRGPAADTFLASCASDPKMAWASALAAGVTTSIEPDSEVFRAYLEHADDRIAKAFLESNNMVWRVAPAELVELAERGNAAMRANVLGWITRLDKFDVALLPRLHDLARRGLAGTDPDWGKSAEQFLCASNSQRDLEGLQLLLGRLPGLRGKQGGIGSPRIWDRYGSGPSAEEVQELMPAIEACVARFPTRAADVPMDSATTWLARLMETVIRAGDGDTVRKALGWWDKGFEVWGALSGKVNASNAVEVFARRHLVAAEQLDDFIRLFGFDGPLPGELYEPMAAMVGEGRFDLLDDLASLLVRTGDERAVRWMLTQWEKDRTGERIVNRSGNSGVGDEQIQNLTRDLAWQMMLFAKGNGGEPVRDGMLRMLQGAGPRRPDDPTRARLLMALLTLGGAEALQCFAADSGRCDTVDAGYHPFLSRQTGKPQSPLQYLLSADPQPPHRYSAEQVATALSGSLDAIGEGRISPQTLSCRDLDERALIVLADKDRYNYGEGLAWENVAASELGRRLEEKDGETALLMKWFEARLAKQGGRPSIVKSGCQWDPLRTLMSARLAAIVDGPDEVWAEVAAQQLWSDYPKDGLAKALKNEHARVRYWAIESIASGLQQLDPQLVVPLLHDADESIRASAAKYLGDAVARDAVPDLIAALRDSEATVRTAAAKSLEQIRFYHDQQAHWDRVNQGMDATPTSACEKLLLQAKPGQPAAQRLLAVESLGTLGVPEALPFLIDWTTDADEAVAKAARAAITAIHLSPRR